MEETKRSLCHIEKITNIFPIEGKDRIVLAEINNGWKCIVDKDSYKINDLIVYTEIDSILPEKPEFEHLRKRCWHEIYKGFRIKTLKFGSTISQGLISPISILPKGKYKEGQDVTELIGATHYDSESPLNKKQIEYKPKNKILKFLLSYSIGRKIILPFIRKEQGSWPEFLTHTDEPRLANMSKVLETFKDGPIYVLEKLDGQSWGVFFRKQKINFFKRYLFGVVSRNVWLKSKNNSIYWKMVEKYDIENVLKNHFKKTGEELILNGEQCGPNIQKNKYDLKEHEIFIFNIINSKTKYHFNLDEMAEFCGKNGLKMCPLVCYDFKQLSNVDEMEKFSRGKSQLNPKTEREGIVVRCIKDGKKLLSYKQISSTFLLKYDL